MISPLPTNLFSDRGALHTGISIVDRTKYTPINELAEAWISVDALLLLGCLHCNGLDSDKAEVFTRIVAPEYDNLVLLVDKDLRMSMMFLITSATILEQMIRDLITNPGL